MFSFVSDNGDGEWKWKMEMETESNMENRINKW